MIDYIRKNNGKYKNNVLKNKFSKCYFLMLKKIRCYINFLRWSIRWSFVVHDGTHLVATRCFLLIPLAIQDWDHLKTTWWALNGP
jgi:hypothetical protein